MPKTNQGLNFLWVIDFEYDTRLHHGALLRYFNFAPELIAQGHSVTFAVNFLDRARGPSIQYFEKLKAEGVFSDFIETNLEAPMWRMRLAARLVHPALSNFVLRPVQSRFAAQIDAIARERNSDVILLSGNRLLFLPLRSESDCAFIYDPGDCVTLFARRRLRFLANNRDFAGWARTLKPALFAYARERYYARTAVMKIMLSPVDKEAMDAIGGKPETSTVVLNGVREGAPQGKYSKIPGRIIFTGNMNFPPNYEAALWFLDHVFPLVLGQRPDVCFVIAGANPIPALLERESKNVVVTGFVEDINREIARSEVFVAPLVSGGGFKNKVLEAIMNRTSVVASSIAVEFFPAAMRRLVTVADSPQDMTEAIMAVWKAPQKAAEQAETLHQFAAAQFSWASRASEVVEIARKAIAQSRTEELR
jgi:glycosyltransferase involved in cell wall biosynthesis